MNQKVKLVLLLLPLIGLGGAVFWAKWKLSHPSATPHDLEVRRLFLQSPNAVLVPLQLNSHQGERYKLTQKDKQEIASHLWLREVAAPGIVHPTGISCVIRWGKGVLFVGESWQQDCCALRSKGYLNEWKPNWVLHNNSSLYLHRWLLQHPQVIRQLGLKIK